MPRFSLPWLALVCALLGAAGYGRPSAAMPQVDAVAFPLARSANGRYLEDLRGKPFPILGRASWLLLSRTRSEYDEFLADTGSKGFDAIEMTAINRIAEGNHVPFNGRGDAPFLRKLDGQPWDGTFRYRDIERDAPDFTTPNPAYWEFLDTFLADCESRGIAVLLFPAYVGYIRTNEGWMDEMVANGSERMQAYGTWVANRYRQRKNIVWMIGGDRGTPPNLFTDRELAVERAFVAGLTGVAGQASTHYSAEWSGPLATSQPDFASRITLDGSYGAATAAYGRQGYASSRILPVFLLEEPYDEEGPDGNNRNPGALQPVRRFEWFGWLNSIGGYVAGNGYVWPFKNGPWWRLRPLYKSHLNTRNTSDLVVLNTLIRSIPWYALVPDGLGSGGHRLVTDGGGTPDMRDYVAAAATDSGTFLVAYAGPWHSGRFTVDLRALRGPVTARWLNPTTGEYTPIGTLTNSAPHQFVTPGNNGTGYRDWALVLTSP